MKLSTKGLAILKHYEGFRANPYLCPAGVCTIGYGTTRYENGKPVRLTDPAITEQDADELLRNDCDKFERGVLRLVKVPLTQWQFDALVLFAYNIGLGALTTSTLLKMLNTNVMNTDHLWQARITAEFGKWCRGGGRKLAGLVARRSSEALLFCKNEVRFFN